MVEHSVAGMEEEEDMVDGSAAGVEEEEGMEAATEAPWVVVKEEVDSLAVAHSVVAWEAEASAARGWGMMAAGERLQG